MKMKYILILILGLGLFSCTEHPEERYTPRIDTDMNDDPNVWVEGRPYYLRGADTTICGKPYSLDSIDDNSVKTFKYQNCWTRRWEHKYTAGGQMIDVWYWDDKVKCWYVMPKTGDYYDFRWSYSTKTLLDQ